MIWNMCQVKGGRTWLVILTAICWLWQRTIIDLNCSSYWNNIILLANLQKQIRDQQNNLPFIITKNKKLVKKN
jgi:hypothetical protein